MKKNKWWLICLLLFAVLFLPVPVGVYKDGGTREFQALTYKLVDWNRLTENGGIYERLRVYFPPHCYRSIDALWDREKKESFSEFYGEIIELSDDLVTVEPMEGERERNSADRIVFSKANLQELPLVTGSKVKLSYPGLIRETYPAQIDVLSWELAGNWQDREYEGSWWEGEQRSEGGDPLALRGIITDIYRDCFLLTTTEPSDIRLKVNGALDKRWCVGDEVSVTLNDYRRNEERNRVEGEMDMVEERIEVFTDYGGDIPALKPVLYLYPTEPTEISVELELKGELSCSYPAYEEGWKVTAMPDGTLTDGAGKQYNYLYWEGNLETAYDFSRGFCVRGEDTARFLEEALEKLGLSPREANEFIVFWLPQMEDNGYNLIRFQTEAYTEAAKLRICPKPDSMIRIFMTWKASDSFVELTPQALTAEDRVGFTVVEWGGTEIP